MEYENHDKISRYFIKIFDYIVAWIKFCRIIC